MLPASLAYGWVLWRRHRWGLLVTLGYLICAAAAASAVCAVAAASALTKGAIDPRIVNGILGAMASMLLLPAAYLVTIFSFGLDADVSGSRESCFPPALFRLPVCTGALVGWPMAYGAVAAALLWLATALFILRPWLSLWNMTVPLWWPAALAAASLAWFQAVLWVPLGLPVFRIVLASILIPGLIALTQIRVQTGASEQSLFALFAGLAAIGWAVGFVGVKYARRGAVPDWSFLARPWHYLTQGLPWRRQPFANADCAHVWFEWRRNGRSLFILTAVLLPFVLLPLFIGKNDAVPAPNTLLGALAVPVFLAGLAGTTVSGSNPWVKDYYGVVLSTATLPMCTAALVAAKLKAAAWSTLAAWTLLALIVPLTLLLTGNMDEITALWQQRLGHHHPVETVAGIIAAIVFLVVWTWKRMVDSLFLGLTGRKWIIQGAIYANLIGIFALVAIGNLIHANPEIRAAAIPLIPWLLGLWVLCRLLLTGWVVRRLLHQKLVEPRTLLRWLLAWLLLGSALFGTLAWVIPRELVPLHYLAFAVLLVLPMAHLAATPLALAWNRHR